MEKIIAECRYKRLTYNENADEYKIYRLTCHLDYGDYCNQWDWICTAATHEAAMHLFKGTPDELRAIDDRK